MSLTKRMISLVLLLLILGTASLSQHPQPYVDPALLQRASRVTGIDSDRVQRHFYVLKNGGAIEITAKDANDEATIKAIRTWLKKESDFFTKGNYESAAAIYGKAPESTIQLKKLRDEVNFAMVQEDNGAVLRMLTVNPQAKAAIHEYLKFQIDQLGTGDPITPPQD